VRRTKPKLTARQRRLERSKQNERKLRRRLRSESNLPVWKTTELGNGKLGIQCPRYGCGGKATVNKKKWIEAKPGFESRSCTYCYAVAWIPEELL
jgi:Zn-finger protein